MMNIDLNRYVSPYKLGRPVITPSGVEGDFNRLGVDCPVPFRHNGKVYMLHVGLTVKATRPRCAWLRMILCSSGNS